MTSPQAVWVKYKLACDSGGHGAVAYTTFLAYWRKLAPQIRVMKPRTDLCWECQKNSRAIMRAATKPEAVKSEVYLISWALLIKNTVIVKRYTHIGGYGKGDRGRHCFS